MIKVKEIVYEAGRAWVHRDASGRAYVVYVNGITHAKSDSAYAFDADGLSLAKARCDYLARSDEAVGK